MLLDNADKDTTAGDLEFHELSDAFCKTFPTAQQQIVELIATQFTTSEPLTLALGLDYDEYKEYFVRPTVDKAIRDGLSLVAMDTTTSSPKVAAGFLNEDFIDAIDDATTERPSNPILENYPAMRPIFQVMEQLDKRIVHKLGGNDKVRSKHVLHAFVLAVSPDYGGRGLAKKLSTLTCQLAKDKGFSHVAVEATNPATTRIWTKPTLGAEIVHSMDGKEFVSSSDNAVTVISRPFAQLDHPLDALLLLL